MEDYKEQVSYEVIPVNEGTGVRFYTSKDPGSYVPTHWHDALEIVYLQSGTLRFTVEGRTVQLQPGQCILVNSNIFHSSLCTAPNTSIVFQIPLSLLNLVIPNMYCTEFQLENRGLPAAEHEKNLKKFKETLCKMQMLNDERPDGGMLLFNSLLYDLLFQLYRNFRVSAAGGSGAENKTETLRRLTVILNYTAQNYTRTIPLQEVAGIAAMQQNYFCRFFKKNMGCTFLEYQNNLRLSYILRDLIQTEDSISSILERHGFKNYKLFNRMFHEKFHMTPTQARKNLRQAAVDKPGKKGD